MKVTLKVTLQGPGDLAQRGAGRAQGPARRQGRRGADRTRPPGDAARRGAPGASESFVGCLEVGGRPGPLARGHRDRCPAEGWAGELCRITADTNVLLRAAVMDDPVQGAIAAEALLEAEIVAVTLPSLCEFVWVLTRGYKKAPARSAAAVRKLVESASVLVDRPAVEAGLAVLEGAATSPTGSSLSKVGAPEAASSRPSTGRRRRSFRRQAAKRGSSARDERSRACFRALLARGGARSRAAGPTTRTRSVGMAITPRPDLDADGESGRLSQIDQGVEAELVERLASDR